MDKPTIIEGVFYITNVCNLTCNNCMSYNDRKFKGHFNWADHADDYIRWSNTVDINRITILGGEPFANPELSIWATNIKALWNTCPDINVCTNGTYLKNNIALSRGLIQQNIWLDVSVHDPVMYDNIKTALEEVLSIFKFTKRITYNHDIGFHKYQYEEYYEDNRLLAKISNQWNFSTNSTTKIVDGITYMHDSQPTIAHKNCAAKYCHYFVKGKLYKCFLTAIANELTDQFKIEDTAKELLLSYQACSADDSPEHIQSFTNNLTAAISQCSLCPETRVSKPIWPLMPSKASL